MNTAVRHNLISPLPVIFFPIDAPPNGHLAKNQADESYTVAGYIFKKFYIAESDEHSNRGRIYMKILPINFALLGAAALVLAGCSSDSSESSSDTMVGGMTECTDAAMQEAVGAVYSAGGFEITGYKCEDGWAYVTTDPAGGEMSAPQMFIFQAEGQFWIPKDAVAVCGTFADGSYPADAAVPASLYDPACLAG